LRALEQQRKRSRFSKLGRFPAEFHAHRSLLSGVSAKEQEFLRYPSTKRGSIKCEEFPKNITVFVDGRKQL
jgi:hypothetical protein